MRPLPVVVVDVDAEHAFEMSAVEDQQPVETFRADAADEAFRDRVGLRRPNRRLHDPDALAAEDLIRLRLMAGPSSRSVLKEGEH
jgi:hypothetical protein